MNSNHSSLRSFSLRAALSTVLCVLVGQVHAGLPRAPENSVVGTWADNRGGIIAIQAQDRAFTLYGTDSSSIYRLTCFGETKDAYALQCMGDGFDYSSGYHFNYRNRLTLNADGSLAEEWVATSARGEEQGKALFKRKATKSDPPSR